MSRPKFNPAPCHRQPAAWDPRRDLSIDAGLDALYLHLPFCFHKCHYCDFYSVGDQPGRDRQESFTLALIEELEAWAQRRPLRPTTVFAGGGTPTYLRPELWGRLLEAMHRLGVLDEAVEFTVEANPETVTAPLMRQLAGGGVNRVSIGAQSFDRASLAALERWHDPDNVGRAVAACRDAGLTNLSLDLIFAIPGQTLAMLEADLDRLLELAPTHLSTYGLTYEPQTPLTARLRLGQVAAVDEDTERQMYATVLDRLEAAGFEHYEVSNWARAEGSVGTRQAEGSIAGDGDRRGGRTEDSAPGDAPLPASAFSPAPSGFRCLHNLAYWQNRNWLGVGPSAASHVDGHRWRNGPNLATYLQQRPGPAEDHEYLPADQKLGERLMLGLRLSDGVDLAWLEPQLADDPRRAAAIDEMVGLEMLERTADRLRLTRRGLFVADSVIARLL